MEEFKKSEEKVDEQLVVKSRQKIFIGTQISDQFGRYVDSGEFENEVDFKTKFLAAKYESLESPQQIRSKKKTKITRSYLSSVANSLSDAILEEI